MSNPWLKKNPFMSMWLSQANRIAGMMRGQAAAQAKRQINTAVTEATNENLRELIRGTAPASRKTRTRKP